jgi:hypothetical protein
MGFILHTETLPDEPIIMKGFDVNLTFGGKFWAILGNFGQF